MRMGTARHSTFHISLLEVPRRRGYQEAERLVRRYPCIRVVSVGPVPLSLKVSRLYAVTGAGMSLRVDNTVTAGNDQAMMGNRFT